MMRMKRSVKVILSFLVLCVVIVTLIYTRPLTIEERYPVLELSQCELISGRFRRDGTDVEDTSFTISPEDPHFDELIDLFQSAEFKTKLRNILPHGTKVHPYQDGDYKWEVTFRFEDVAFPNGDIGSGDMLHIDNFYGEIELFFDGQQTECSLKNQDEWLDDIMSIITQYPAR